MKKANIDYNEVTKNADLKFNELKINKCGEIFFIVDKYIQRRGYKYRLIIKNKSLRYFKSFNTFKEAVEERDRILSENKIIRTKWGGEDRRKKKIQVAPGIFKLSDGSYFLQTSKKGEKIRKIFTSLKEAKEYKEKEVGIDLYSGKKELIDEILLYTTDQHNWQPIDELNKYWVSQYGYVVSYANNGFAKPIKMQVSKDNRLYFLATSKTTGRKHFFLHVILAEKFIPNPNNYKYVNFIDGDTKNIKLSNLEWSNKLFQPINQIKHKVNLINVKTKKVIKTFDSICECLRSYTDLTKSKLITLAKNKKVYKDEFIFEIIKYVKEDNLPKNVIKNKYNNTYFIKFNFNNKKYIKYGFKTVDEAREGLKKLKIVALNEK